MKEPRWAFVDYPPIGYQEIVYYAAPVRKPEYESLDQVDPELLRTYEKLGIPLEEQKALAGVAVNDSIVLVAFINELRRRGDDLLESLVEAGRLRLRPIILTSLTTISGLVPMALGIGGISEMWSPLANVILFGLLVATVPIRRAPGRGCTPIRSGSTNMTVTVSASLTEASSSSSAVTVTVVVP